jgi:hypothetical protein
MFGADSHIVSIATITGFEPNDPHNHPNWFSPERGVDKWLDPLARRKPGPSGPGQGARRPRSRRRLANLPEMFSTFSCSGPLSLFQFRYAG